MLIESLCHIHDLFLSQHKVFSHWLFHLLCYKWNNHDKGFATELGKINRKFLFEGTCSQLNFLNLII